MKNLSPSAEKICEQALLHFAVRGYDASSLNDIAEACGIRKASLYAHFKGKDEIYTAVFERALASEREHAAQCFNVSESDLQGGTYIEELEARYAEQPSLRFLLRAVFFPPASLHQLITAGFEEHLDAIRENFIKQCEERVKQSHVAGLADAYLAIVDSLHVELIYGNTQVYKRRLAAVRGLLVLGVTDGQ